MLRRIFWVIGLMAGLVSFVFAQDSVDVTFYYKPSGSPTAVYLPGEFNGWGPNSGGIISSGAPSLMTKDPVTGVWSKTYRLRVGGPQSGGGVAGAYQYKFNENGTNWIPDPLNPRQNQQDNNNSELFVTSPTIFHFLPNSKSGIVSTQFPVISAYIYPSLASGVDTSSFVIQIDTLSYSIPGTSYDPATNLLSFRSPISLYNGTRFMKLSVKNLGGTEVFDTASFFVRGGFVQITTLGNFTTRLSGRAINGTVADTSIHSVTVVQNSQDSISTSVTNGKFSVNETLVEGLNSFRAFVRDSTGAIQTSDSIAFTYFINHTPTAKITFSTSGSDITFSADASSDPDYGQSAQLTYQWGTDSANPQSLAGVDGSTQSQIAVSIPSKPGEYYITLIAADPNGNADTTRSFFDVNKDGTATGATFATVPQWVKSGRIYSIFFKGLTSQGTINAALPYLNYIKNMGFNIIWVLPVMENASPIDNGGGPGYNIVDFYKVASEYGTNADFKNFVNQAHQLGLKVILDVTPNHTSYAHPFVSEGRIFRTDSPHWTFYQHQIIPSGDNGVGPQSIDPDGFVYYGGFSSQLLNYNWADVDARAYMVGVYSWWVKQMGIDGFRFDVYWGPHNRANNGAGGENEMGVPVRQAIKHVKPDSYLLGETAGTGGGTEVNYADDNGGIDGAYDWTLKDEIHYEAQNGFNVDNLNAKIYNNNYYPGPNSSFLRFLENQDEDRIAYLCGSFARTMPLGTVIFTAPGMPMIWEGQEVGMGLGDSNFDHRRRGVVDWNFSGKSLLQPHYQKLAWIRGMFPAFSTHTFIRLSTGNSLVYGYTRPFTDQNGIALENFNGSSASASITLSGSGGSPNVSFTGGAVDGKTYYMNDVYNDTSYAVSFSGGSLTFNTTLPAYGSAVYILCDSIVHLQLPLLTSVEEHQQGLAPDHFTLEQNYPNPFNPTTNIRFTIQSAVFTSLKVYDILGREIKTLVSERKSPGTYDVNFDGSNLASGMYLYRFQAGSFISTKRMVLMK
jgi:glycosidase